MQMFGVSGPGLAAKSESEYRAPGTWDHENASPDFNGAPVGGLRKDGGESPPTPPRSRGNVYVVTMWESRIPSARSTRPETRRVGTPTSWKVIRFGSPLRSGTPARAGWRSRFLARGACQVELG